MPHDYYEDLSTGSFDAYREVSQNPRKYGLHTEQGFNKFVDFLEQEGYSPASRMRELSKSNDIDVVKNVARCLKTPKSVLVELAGSDNDEIASIVARNPQTPEDVLVMLSLHPASDVKAGVLLNPSASMATLEHLSMDSNILIGACANRQKDEAMKSLRADFFGQSFSAEEGLKKKRPPVDAYFDFSHEVKAVKRKLERMNMRDIPARDVYSDNSNLSHGWVKQLTGLNKNRNTGNLTYVSYYNTDAATKKAIPEILELYYPNGDLYMVGGLNEFFLPSGKWETYAPLTGDLMRREFFIPDMPNSITESGDIRLQSVNAGFKAEWEYGWNRETGWIERYLRSYTEYEMIEVGTKKSVIKDGQPVQKFEDEERKPNVKFKMDFNEAGALVSGVKYERGNALSRLLIGANLSPEGKEMTEKEASKILSSPTVQHRINPQGVKQNPSNALTGLRMNDRNREEYRETFARMKREERPSIKDLPSVKSGLSDKIREKFGDNRPKLEDMASYVGLKQSVLQETPKVGETKKLKH